MTTQMEGLLLCAGLFTLLACVAYGFAVRERQARILATLPQRIVASVVDAKDVIMIPKTNS